MPFMGTAMLTEQLKVVRRFIKDENGDTQRDTTSSTTSKTKISIVRDILYDEGGSLHISDIIQKAKKNFDVILDRESIVSSLTKKVAKGDTFIRTAPNTFQLKAQNEAKRN